MNAKVTAKLARKKWYTVDVKSVSDDALIYCEGGFGCDIQSVIDGLCSSFADRQHTVYFAVTDSDGNEIDW